MEKFSRMKPKEESVEHENILFDGEHCKIIDIDGWSVLDNKDAVVCIPYLIETNQIVLRYEYIPAFEYVDGQQFHLTLVCGGIEMGETPEMALSRELEEEAGIVLREDYKPEPLKPIFVNKSSVNKYFPYILPLNERDYHEVVAKGDGSKFEKVSKSVKVDLKYISSLNPSDLITEYMLLKLKEYLNY